MIPEPHLLDSVVTEPDNRFYAEFCRYLESGNLNLPTIPDISLKIRSAITNRKANNNKIAKVVQLDPAITARLIKIANSPLYRGRKQIESCPEALTRLGLKAAQDFITSFALKSVFRAKSNAIQTRMQDLWSHSSYVAAICAVLAHKTPGFDPDRAMLAGLIHDIGVVPILIFADGHADLVTRTDDLDETIRLLRGPIGALIMREWAFPSDFEEIVQYAEDWMRDKNPKPDYTDLVIISQLHSFVGSTTIHRYPPMDTLPAYRKLVAGKLDADLSMNILETVKDEIADIRQLLTG